ncbi:MAG: hypothetical protein R3346_01190 [Candidatus Spechtbacterales bacterium]|nr:hypothetical protein [Candidatus Spechtbacterales bacterium]
MKYMKAYFVSILVTIFLFGSLALPTSASCAESTLEEQYSRADLVVRGTAISSGNNIFKGEYYEFSVDKYFKGDGPAIIKVTGKQDKNAETSIDFNIEEGARYLLFLNGNTEEELKTNSCSGSKEVHEPLSNKELFVLGTGKAPQYEKKAPGILSNFALATITLVVLSGTGVGIFFLKKELKERTHDDPDVHLH